MPKRTWLRAAAPLLALSWVAACEGSAASLPDATIDLAATMGDAAMGSRDAALPPGLVCRTGSECAPGVENACLLFCIQGMPNPPSIALNRGELTNYKPTHADGSACGGSGALAGFDCNGDGALTVSDYKDSPTLRPPASSGHPQGDLNRNGALDAADLVLQFSNGVDDDGNGYPDDIARIDCTCRSSGTADCLCPR